MKMAFGFLEGFLVAEHGGCDSPNPNSSIVNKIN